MITHVLPPATARSQLPTHLPGVCNSAADTFSWNQRVEFLTAHHQPHRDPAPYAITPSCVFYPLKCSTGYQQHFNNIIRHVDSNSAATPGAFTIYLTITSKTVTDTCPYIPIGT